MHTSQSAQLFPSAPAGSGRCVQTLTCQPVLSIRCVPVKSDNEGCPRAVLIPRSGQRSAVVKESNNGGIISGFQQVQIFIASCCCLNSLSLFFFCVCVCGTEEPSWLAFAIPILTCTLPKERLSADTCLLKLSLYVCLYPDRDQPSVHNCLLKPVPLSLPVPAP